MSGKNNETTEKLARFLQDNALQLTVQMVGVLVLILNLWLTSKLYPLAENIKLVQQVLAQQETRLTKLENEGSTNAQISANDIKAIKESLTRIEQKLDTHLNK